MRKIIVGSFITLDRVMQAAGGPEEGFKYGGWSAPHYDEALDKIAEIQKQPAKDLLLQTLLQHDLVDELWLLIHPLTLGTGNKLFADGTIPAAFTLAESTATPSGVIAAHYKRAGEVKTGMMGV